MSKMSTLSFDACHESFAKAQSSFANCFIRKIVPDSLQRRFQVRYVLQFRF